MSVEVTENKFYDEVIHSPKPVLVDFWAPWCGPCRMVAPVVEEIAREYEDKLKVVKINVDENTGIADRYDIQSIPTLKFFKDGSVIDTIVGFRSKSALEKAVSKLI